MKMADKEVSGRQLSYRFRIYPTDEQKRHMAVNFGCCRYVYNYFLDKRIEAYQKNGKDGSLSYVDTSRMLTDLKKSAKDDDGHTWLYDADATALCYSLRHLDAAYSNFFRRVAKAKAGASEGDKMGFPKFKSKHGSKKAYTIAGKQVKLSDGAVYLAKAGWVPAVIHREVEGRFVSATVSLNKAGQYHVSINVDGAPPVEVPEGKGEVGVTCGLNPWVVLSDGTVYDNPEPLEKLNKKLAREQRRLSRKEKGSANYEKQRLKVAKLHQRISDMRKDATHKMTSEIVASHETVFAREMGSKSMMEQGGRAFENSPRSVRRNMNRRLADANLFEVNRQLSYKSEWAGRDFVMVPVLAPTAQVCGKCGHKEESVAENLRPVWTCPVCGERHGRKENGASNVLDVGRDLLQGSEAPSPATKALADLLEEEPAQAVLSAC